MQPHWKHLTINPDRLKAAFDALSAIGQTGETGVSRPALSEAHLAARAWFRRQAAAAGLQFEQDGAGNHLARLVCGPQGARSLVLGSHLDSVPTGGRFDGALGVLAGLEVLRTVREAGLQLPVHLEVIDFTDEEGALVSFLGSFAFAGLLRPEDLADPRGDRAALQAGLQRAGLTADGILAARRDPQTLAGYLELHVEQGPVLHQSGYQVGVVTHIAGISFYRLVFHGRAAHAGTISMADRRDAGLGAGAFTLALRDLLLERFPDCFANVGAVRYHPGAFNIVPARAELSLEVRAGAVEEFENLKTEALRQAELAAARFDLGLEVFHLGQRLPVEMDPAARAAIRESAAAFGLRALDLGSRAGHDAQALAAVCPTGMIFVPSVEGLSHSPDEFTPWEDCLNGANVLLQTTLRLAARLENHPA